jgi:hypothetical protein
MNELYLGTFGDENFLSLSISFRKKVTSVRNSHYPLSSTSYKVPLLQASNGYEFVSLYFSVISHDYAELSTFHGIPL